MAHVRARHVLFLMPLVFGGQGPLWAQEILREPETVSERFNTLTRAPALRAGGWEINPVAELRAGYDSNINFSAVAGRSSSLVELRGQINATREIGPDQIAIEALVQQQLYLESASDNEATASIVLRGQAYAGEETQIRGSVGISYDVEASTAADSGTITGGTFDPYTTRATRVRVPVEAGIARDIGRWFGDANATATWTQYDDLQTEGGTTIQQDFRNGWEVTAQLRGGYRLTTGVGAFGRVEVQDRSFEDATANNQGLRLSAGAQFEFTRLLTGEVTLGWTAQHFNVSGETESGFTYSGELNWYANPLLSISLAGARTFEGQQTVSASGAATTTPILRDSVALRAELEALRTLLVFAEGRYVANASEDGALDDQLIELEVGSNYSLTRTVRLDTSYTYSAAQTTSSGDPVRNLVTVGLSAAF